MKKSSFKVALACSFVIASCSTSPQGRKQLTAPLPVSEAYSDADMRIQLATASSVSSPCIGVECTRNQEFDQQVQSVGYRLALAAYVAYPELIKRVSEFQFEVAEKSEPGSTSNASGKIVIYRGVQKLEFDEAGVAFLVAREMGHVIGQHHEENSGTKILLSIAVGVLFPALHLFNGTAQLAQATQATTATTLGTTVASTATSYVGSKAILAGIRPDQLSEADVIGMALLAREGWHLHDVASVLDRSEEIKEGSSWAEDLRVSVNRLRALDAENKLTDISQQAGAIVLRVQRECSAEPEAQTSTNPINNMPVMAKELAPEVIPATAPEAAEPTVEPLKVEPFPELTEVTTGLDADADLPQAAQAEVNPNPPARLRTVQSLQKRAATSKKSSMKKASKSSRSANAKKTPRGKIIKKKPPARQKMAKLKTRSLPTRTAKSKAIR